MNATIACCGPAIWVMDRTLVSMIRKKYQLLASALDERQRRLWAATEAQAMGRGGVAAVARATRLAHTTILRGTEHLESGR